MLRRSNKQSLLSQSTVVITGTSLMSIANLAFNIAAAHLLAPSGYGALSSILTVSAIGAVLLNALQMASTHAAAVAGNSDAANVRAVLATGFLICVAGGALLVAFSPLIAAYLRVDVVPVAIMGTWFIPSGMTAMLEGILVGKGRPIGAAVSMVLGALVRLASGLVVLELGGGVTGAVLASLAGAIATMLLLVTWLQEDIRRSEKGLRLRLDSSLRSLSCLLGYSVFAAADLALARHYYPPRIAGYYAAGSTAGRAALYLPTAVALVTFPAIARQARSGGSSSRRLMVVSAFVTAALGAVPAVVLSAVPGFAMRTIFGSTYGDGATVVILLTWSACGLAVIAIVSRQFVALGSAYAHVPWVANVIFVGSVLLVGPQRGTTSIASCFLGSTIFIILILVWATLRMPTGQHVDDQEPSEVLP